MRSRASCAVMGEQKRVDDVVSKLKLQSTTSNQSEVDYAYYYLWIMALRGDGRFLDIFQRGHLPLPGPHHMQ